MINQIDYSTNYIIKRLLSKHIKPYSVMIVLAIIFMIIVAASNAAIVSKTEPLVNEIILTHNRDMLTFVFLTVLAMFIVKGIAEYFQNYLIKFVGQRILTDLQMLMYEHLLKSDLQLIQMQSSGRLISRFTNDISLMRGAVSNLLVGFAKHLLTVVFMICLMFKLEPLLSLYTFAAFPLAIYPVQRLGRRMRKIAYEAQEQLGNYTAKLDEAFQSIKVVKSYIAEDIEVDRAKTMTERILKLYKKAAKLDALTSPIMEILSGVAIAGIMWYGGSLVIDGKTTPGALLTFIAAFFSSYRPYKSLVVLNVNLQEGLAASKRLFQILDTEPKVRNHPNAIPVYFSKPDILFQDVGLVFGGKTAITHLNLTIPAGKKVAIVGRSGGGKTSIANLLVRFYDPSYGTIMVEGHDISKITISSLRQQISLITQDTMLFDASVLDNIAYGRLSATKQEIIEAAKNADAHEFITSLPQGYSTVIGAQGLTLSGGQRQRLAIARAFLKNAPILIMDEATSALDSASERSILQALESLAKNRTTIIITHRLSSITKSDEIIVIDGGQIVERGTHDELMKKQTIYRDLYIRGEEE